MRASSHAERRTLVFLGDYVDRGPDSKGVVETLIGGLPKGFEAHFLKGNHEAILLNFLDDAWSLDNWLLNGGDATMRSYGLDTDRLARLDAPIELWRQALQEAMPETHLHFYRSLRLSVAFGDYLFVHAGVNPSVPLGEQSEADLIWIRGPFLDHAGSIRQDRGAWTYAWKGAGHAIEPYRHRYGRVLHRAADGAETRARLAAIPADLKRR